MGMMEIIGIAGSVSLLAGWRLYLAMFATGLAMRLDALPLPDNLAALDALANPWVMGATGLAAVAEFLADKVMWLDSAWDAVHTFVRPVGGALLALAVIDPSDPVTQVLAFVLGGGASLAAHAGKAGVRGAVNTSLEPVSNVVVSTTEDVATAGLLYATYEYPWAAAGIAAVLLTIVVGLLLLARKAIRTLFRRREAPPR